MKNMRHPPAKLTAFDSNLNRLLIYVFIANCVICLLSGGLGTILERTAGFGYLDKLYPSAGESFAQFFIQYFVLYSYFIPISLTVTIEVLRVFYKVLISWDPEFCDPEFGHATAHNISQIGQLGLVTDVLSDKTGTLTENIMEMLRFATVHDRYNARDFVNQIDLLREINLPFLLALALCNNVVVHEKRDRTLEYNADSPDEAAFVDFASACGIKLIARGVSSMTIQICGVSKEYQILAHLPFNADRKRMSILVRAEGEPAVLYCKGADNVIQPRALEFSSTQTVNEYAVMGLRTLVFTSRVIENDELGPWLTAFQESSAVLVDRERQIEERASEIECRLEVLGVSGVEDRLQPYVPETIAWLRRARIKLWILTGDKLETAVAIGKTSGVIQPNAESVMITSDDRFLVRRRIEAIRGSLHSFQSPVLVITGSAVEYCLYDWLDEFMSLASHMSAVILSRVSPFVKAQVASAVADHGSMTLAIGDGANDVGMIQVARVGVGVYGREGSQAAHSSDFAIPRFHDLVRLLTVHGHWTYNRFSMVAVIMLYKNMTFILNQLWFSFDTLWSPTSLFDEFFLSVFNLVFTVVPPFAFGCFEQDLPQEILQVTPELYPVDSDPMEGWNIINIIILAIYQSLISYYSVRWNLKHDTRMAAGVMCYITIVCIVLVQIIMWSNSQNMITLVGYIVNILAVPLVCFVYMGAFDPQMKGVLQVELGQAYPWLGMLVAIVAGLLPGFFVHLVRNRFRPTKIRLWSERLRLAKLLETPLEKAPEPEVGVVSVEPPNTP
jgi:phospholipid-translocating P-type ATPase (flippase)